MTKWFFFGTTFVSKSNFWLFGATFWETSSNLYKARGGLLVRNIHYALSFFAQIFLNCSIFFFCYLIMLSLRSWRDTRVGERWRSRCIPETPYNQPPEMKCLPNPWSWPLVTSLSQVPSWTQRKLLKGKLLRENEMQGSCTCKCECKCKDLSIWEHLQLCVTKYQDDLRRNAEAFINWTDKSNDRLSFAHAANLRAI